MPAPIRITLSSVRMPSGQTRNSSRFGLSFAANNFANCASTAPGHLTFCMTVSFYCWVRSFPRHPARVLSWFRRNSPLSARFRKCCNRPVSLSQASLLAVGGALSPCVRCDCQKLSSYNQRVQSIRLQVPGFHRLSCHALPC